MSRVPKSTETPGTEMTAAPAAGPLANFDMSVAHGADAPSPGGFLPTLKIPYPIEVGKRGISAEHLFKLGITDGRAFTVLAQPCVLTVIASRNAARTLTDKQGGGKSYVYACAKCAGLGKSATKYVDLAKAAPTDDSISLGARYLVAVFLADGSVAIINVDAFDTMRDYLGAPLAPAKFLPDKIGVELNCTDHSGNQTATRADPSKTYLDPRKHKQWRTIPLTDAQVKAVGVAWEKDKKAIEGWLDQ